VTILLPEMNAVKVDEYSPEIISEPIERYDSNDTEMTIADEHEMGSKKEETTSKKRKRGERGVLSKDTETSTADNQTVDAEKDETSKKEDTACGPSERRHWEVCEKARNQPLLSLVWNYFLVYKDHQDLQVGICKACYYLKKDSSSYSPSDWEPFFHSTKAPRKFESHLKNYHPDSYEQLTQEKEKLKSDTEERQGWEICEKHDENKHRIWNYFYVYKDHPEFRAVICKTCYEKKDSKTSPKCWEHRHGSRVREPHV
jgi:hypothetical protein